MKELFLIRHAHAGPYLLPDEGRNLSIRGIEEAQELRAIFLKSNFFCGKKFEKSPYFNGCGIVGCKKKWKKLKK